MNKAKLEEKLKAVEETFNKIKFEREEALEKAASLLADMNKLQGEYKVLSELVNELPKEKK